MVNQTINREGSGSMKGRVTTASYGLLRAVLVGALLFGFPLALYGVLYSLTNPPVIHGKSGDEKNTVLGWATGLFCTGAILGGVAGAIGWVVMIGLDWLRKLFPTT
jgi:hypothetical protein